MKPPKKYERWTADDRNAMRMLAAQGMSHADIAERLGRTPLAIREQLYLSKTYKAPARWTDEDRDLLRTQHAQGVSPEDAGKRLNRTPLAVTLMLHRMRKQDKVERFIDVAVEDYHEVEAPPKPSLWRRIINVIRRV